MNDRQIWAPGYEIDRRWTWQMYQFVPRGWSYLTTSARPSRIRWWLASRIAQFAAWLGNGGVSLYGFWADGDERIVKAAYTDAMKRTGGLFVQSMEGDVRMHLADKALNEALTADRKLARRPA